MTPLIEPLPEIKLADLKYVPRLLEIFPTLSESIDVLAAFDLLISCYDDYIAVNGRDQKIESGIRDIVKAHPERCKGILEYWSMIDDWPLEAATYPEDWELEEGEPIDSYIFSATLFTRELLKTLYPTA